MDIEDFNINIPTVHIETEFFSGDAIEMYEMPSRMIMPLIGNSGPEQMEDMLGVFKLALIDQNKVADLEFLSFNELANVLMKWWVGSTMKVQQETRELEEKLAKLGTEIELVMEQLEDASSETEIGIATYEYEGEKMDFKITQNPDGSIEIQLIDGPAANDPGDNISPFDV